eukprot:TRINITY_DN4239_c0_g1_i1.p1 TRINITY_DN4239_c0_g1~~TRINITY_DN4239_c0_g1_i1.p1  ORF type:complete len:588 (-),score=104.43 TRINITY_DN4239_c0_g1_i1:415-2112(-)
MAVASCLVAALGMAFAAPVRAAALPSCTLPDAVGLDVVGLQNSEFNGFYRSISATLFLQHIPWRPSCSEPSLRMEAGECWALDWKPIPLDHDHDSVEHCLEECLRVMGSGSGCCRFGDRYHKAPEGCALGHNFMLTQHQASGFHTTAKVATCNEPAAITFCERLAKWTLLLPGQAWNSTAKELCETTLDIVATGAGSETLLTQGFDEELGFWSNMWFRRDHAQTKVSLRCMDDEKRASGAEVVPLDPFRQVASPKCEMQDATGILISGLNNPRFNGLYEETSPGEWHASGCTVRYQQTLGQDTLGCRTEELSMQWGECFADHWTNFTAANEDDCLEQCKRHHFLNETGCCQFIRDPQRPSQGLACRAARRYVTAQHRVSQADTTSKVATCQMPAVIAHCPGAGKWLLALPNFLNFLVPSVEFGSAALQSPAGVVHELSVAASGALTYEPVRIRSVWQCRQTESDLSNATAGHYQEERTSKILEVVLPIVAGVVVVLCLCIVSCRLQRCCRRPADQEASLKKAQEDDNVVVGVPEEKIGEEEAEHRGGVAGFASSPVVTPWGATAV